MSSLGRAVTLPIVMALLLALAVAAPPDAGAAGGADYVQVAAGQYHTCAVTDAGEAYCWGENEYGQLGDGTTIDRDTPTRVSGLLGVAGISAGRYHTCAATAAGEPYCWGENDQGQLGDGTYSDSHVPTRVSGLAGVVDISAGAYHTCAATVNGDAYCWGTNGGRLGDGGTNTRHTPTQVSGLAGVADISAARYHTCAVTVAGEAYCWGDNSEGQLGDGTTSDSTTPVQVQAPGTGDLIGVVPSDRKESEQCEAAGGSQGRVIDSTAQGVRTFVYVYQPTVDEVWVCARVEDTSTGEGYGGRLEATPTDVDPQVIGVPGAPSTDSDSTACTTTTPNDVPGSHPIASGGVATVDYMVDAYADNDEAWVCLQVGSSDHRVVVPLSSGTPDVQFGTVASWHPDQ